MLPLVAGNKGVSRSVHAAVRRVCRGRVSVGGDHQVALPALPAVVNELWEVEIWKDDELWEVIWRSYRVVAKRPVMKVISVWDGMQRHCIRSYTQGFWSDALVSDCVVVCCGREERMNQHMEVYGHGVEVIDCSDSCPHEVVILVRVLMVDKHQSQEGDRYSI